MKTIIKVAKKKLTASKRVRSKTTSKSKVTPVTEDSDDQTGGTPAASTSTPPPAATPGDDKAITVPGLRFGIDRDLVESIVTSVDNIQKTTKIEDVAKAILESIRLGDKNTKAAVNASMLVIAHAWKCGKCLNRAKEISEKGKFDKWRKENFVTPGHVKLRTSQRYMALASQWHILEDLLASAPSLRVAYQHCGILPHADNLAGSGGSGGTEDGDPVANYIGEFSKVQGVLRRLAALKSKIPVGTSVKVPKETIVQLKAAVNEINTFAQTLWGKPA